MKLFRQTLPGHDGAMTLTARLTPAQSALCAQICGGILTACGYALFPAGGATAWAFGQGAAAALTGHWLGLAGWWLPLNLLFVPAALWLLAFDLPPLWFLGVFLFLALVYWDTHQTQVPLFLSSRAAQRALAGLLPQQERVAFLDLGCGAGGVLAALCRARPGGIYHGVETAPLPYLAARVRALRPANRFRVFRRDFWEVDLGGYDVVYAYLSPVPMAALWRKACGEMRPGSLFVSNSFPVPGAAADQAIELGGGAKLYLWRMGASPC